MTNLRPHAEQKPARTRKKYETPRLQEHGSIGKLTQGGAEGSPDGINQQMITPPCL